MSGWFSYVDGSFERHDTAEEAKDFADRCLDDFRDDACDGWSDESLNICWGQVIGDVQVTGSRDRTDEDCVSPHIDVIEERKLISDPLSHLQELEIDRRNALKTIYWFQSFHLNSLPKYARKEVSEAFGDLAASLFRDCDDTEE